MNIKIDKIILITNNEYNIYNYKNKKKNQNSKVKRNLKIIKKQMFK